MDDDIQALNFDNLADDLDEFSTFSSACEIHGLVSGLASVGLIADVDKMLVIVKKYLQTDSIEKRSEEAIVNIQKNVISQLADSDFTFQLLLPDDDEELQSRLDGLSQWCQGFLTGFGTGVRQDQANFSDDAQEVLRDLVNISNVDSDSVEKEDFDSEEDEVAYTELQEYVRTAVMILFSEFSSGVVQAKSPQVTSADDDSDSSEDVYH